MKASELMGDVPALKVLIYGPPGTGKTSWAARSPNPFVLAAEINGLPTIRKVADGEADVELIDDYREFNEFMRAVVVGTDVTINGGPVAEGQHAYRFVFRGRERVCSTIVIESLTDIQEMMARYILESRDASRTETMKLQDYGRLFNGTSTVIRDLRALPVSVVCIAFADFITDEGGAVVKVKPGITGKAGKYVPHWFNAVGYCAKKERSGGLEYGIGWELPSLWESKSAPGFPPYMVNEERVRGKTTLGSLMLSVLPEGPVPFMPGDDPKYVAEAVKAFGKETTDDE